MAALSSVCQVLPAATYSQSSPKEKLPLYLTRPEEVQRAIEENFAIASKIKWYKNLGAKEYRFELMEVKPDSDKIVTKIVFSDEILKRVVPRDSKLLDIGTGNGEFLLQAEGKFKVIATGISANDFRNSGNPPIPDQQYQVANVENISTWSNEKYKTITGSWIGNHLTDSLGTIEQLYNNHLEEGGYMIIHKLNVHCGEQINPIQFMEELVDHLNQTGNCRAAVGANLGEPTLGVPAAMCDFLFIQKLNDKPLDLPISYLENPVSNKYNSNRFAAYKMDPSRNVPKSDAKQVLNGCRDPLDFFK